MYHFTIEELKEIELKAEMLKDTSPSEEYAIAYQKLSEGSKELRVLIEDQIRHLRAAHISQQLKQAHKNAEKCKE